jgi:hypothetical protein
MATSKKVVFQAGKLLPQANVPQKTKGPMASAIAQTPEKRKENR